VWLHEVVSVIPPKPERSRVKQDPPTPVRFSDEQKSAIARISAETGWSRNAVVRFLVDAGLEKYRAEQAKKKTR
jgi:hypothetical protein